MKHFYSKAYSTSFAKNLSPIGTLPAIYLTDRLCNANVVYFNILFPFCKFIVSTCLVNINFQIELRRILSAGVTKKGDFLDNFAGIMNM